MQQSDTPRSGDNLPRNEIFTHPREQRFFAWYRKFFSIAEIENTFLLQWAFGAILLTYFVSFFDYIKEHAITITAYEQNAYSCWSYFQNCGAYYFLEALPYGYSQSYLYLFFFGLMVLIVYLISRKDWVLAHLLLWPLFIWKVLVIFVLSASMGGNYDYYDIIFSFIMLVLPAKLFFLKVTFVTLYFFSTTIKIHEGWVLGTYFTSLKTGLPIFPDSLTPIITNLVIFMQMVGSWFLLSSRPVLQRTVLIYFLCFHFYSGILVHYRYITTAIPMLLILFGPYYTKTPVPSFPKAVFGWMMLFLLLLWQLIPFTISGDQKLTMEGNRFGLYMFEANHQCISVHTVTLTDGTTHEVTKESASARQRCDPYKYWFALQQICSRSTNVSRIAWTFDHSINGGPFYRIVDTANACDLTYRTFMHNDWIKRDTDMPPIIGYPVKNLYY